MRILKRLFGKREPPQEAVNIQGVGIVKWNEETEYWEGVFGVLKISIAYDGVPSPSKDLLRIVRSFLLGEGSLSQAMAKIKELAKSKYPPDKHSEIESLNPKEIVFQSATFILIQFFGSEDNEPFWFGEIHGDEVYVGYDT